MGLVKTNFFDALKLPIGAEDGESESAEAAEMKKSIHRESLETPEDHDDPSKKASNPRAAKKPAKQLPKSAKSTQKPAKKGSKAANKTKTPATSAKKSKR